MPEISQTHKNYILENETDIPPKYKEEIEKRLNTNNPTKQIPISEIISGKRGKLIKDETKIKDLFKDNQHLYFGHGTTGGEEIISSILKQGLSIIDSSNIKGYGSHLEGMDSTAIPLGEGSTSLFDRQKNKLNNWPHKDAKNIIIISLPLKYTLKNKIINIALDMFMPFYVGNNEEGYKLRPEFIKGIYNADSQTFTPNENFYQNLEPEQQQKIFESVKQQYVKFCSEYLLVYPESVKNILPLNETEIEELTIEWYKTQLERLRQDKTFQPDILNADLHEITNETLISDFNDTTHLIKDSIEQNLSEDRDNADEGWSLDDDW